MKQSIVIIALLLCGTSVTFAAREYIRGVKVAEVEPVGLIKTNIYKFDDGEVSCYLGYIAGNRNTPPVMSCVK